MTRRRLIIELDVDTDSAAPMGAAMRVVRQGPEIVAAHWSSTPIDARSTVKTVAVFDPGHFGYTGHNPPRMSDRQAIIDLIDALLKGFAGTTIRADLKTIRTQLMEGT